MVTKDHKHCLNCRHGRLDPVASKVTCNHPQRPRTSAAAVEVIRWAVGCPQHEKEDADARPK